MSKFTTDDRVRIDIPDETDFDHDQYHGQHGMVVSILTDDTRELTGDDEDSRLYRVELDSGHTTDFRRYDLRPPME